MSGQTITRAHIAEALQSELDIPKQDAAQLVETFLDLISDELVAGATVKLSSFGAFSVRDKNERVGRNPKTGEEAPIPPRRVLVFKPSQILKDRVEQGCGG